MAVNTVEYAPTLTADTTAHPSPAIWGGVPINQIKEDPTYGFGFHEDFTTFRGIVTSNVGNYITDAGAWKSYEDTSCTILPLTAFPSGVVRLSVTATGSKASVMEMGNGVGTTLPTTMGAFKYTDGSGGALYYECRVRLGSITDSIQNTFIGLAQSATAIVPAAATSSTTLYDSGTTAGQTDHIGFCIQTGSGNGAYICACYGKVSVAQTIVGIVQTAADTSTWYKLGFIIDPRASAQYLGQGINFDNSVGRKKGRFFVNGIEQAYITDTGAGAKNLNFASGTGAALTTPATASSAIAGTAFPTAKQLTPVVHAETVTSTALTLDVDFIRCYQLYVS